MECNTDFTVTTANCSNIGTIEGYCREDNSGCLEDNDNINPNLPMYIVVTSNNLIDYSSSCNYFDYAIYQFYQLLQGTHELIPIHDEDNYIYIWQKEFSTSEIDFGSYTVKKRLIIDSCDTCYGVATSHYEEGNTCVNISGVNNLTFKIGIEKRRVSSYLTTGQCCNGFKNRNIYRIYLMCNGYYLDLRQFCGCPSSSIVPTSVNLYQIGFGGIIINFQQ